MSKETVDFDLEEPYLAMAWMRALQLMQADSHMKPQQALTEAAAELYLEVVGPVSGEGTRPFNGAQLVRGKTFLVCIRVPLP